jgi:DNA-binding MarR family transcriptional regulator
VERRPGIGVTAAATALRTAPNTVSTLVGELSRAGLLERVRPPENRRAVRLALTTAARVRLAAYREHRRHLLSGVLAGLDPAARAALLDATPHLARLVELVERADPTSAAGERGGPPGVTPPV